MNYEPKSIVALILIFVALLLAAAFTVHSTIGQIDSSSAHSNDVEISIKGELLTAEEAARYLDSL